MSARPAPVSPPPEIPRGYCGVRMRLFASPSQELQQALQPPWPRWMVRLYETEEASDPGVDVHEGVTTVSAAVSALRDKLMHRLDVLAWTCAVLTGLGWIIELQGDWLVAAVRMSPADARRALEDAGAAGAMAVVADLDDDGWPRLWSDTIVGDVR